MTPYLVGTVVNYHGSGTYVITDHEQPRPDVPDPTLAALYADESDYHPTGEVTAGNALRQCLRRIAAIWSPHPDYGQSWAVE